MRRRSWLAAAMAFTLCSFTVVAVGCGDGTSEAGDGGTGGGGGEGAALGGGAGGGGEGGAGGVACNLLDLEGSGETCHRCVGDALMGACQTTGLSCLQANPNAISCAASSGCTRPGEEPPIDLACLASTCTVEFVQLNACLQGCEAYADCFR